MRTIARAFVPLLGIGLVFSPVIGAEPPDEVVAVVPRDFPPLYQVDSQGRPYGHSIDIMERLAETARLRVRYVVRPDWESAMAALRQGEADLIPNLGITRERLSDFDFTSPLETMALGLFVRSDDTGVNGMEELAKVKTAVIRGNAAVDWIRNYPLVDAREFQSQEQALFALLAGEVDALIYPITVTWRMASAIDVDSRIRQAGLPLLEIKRAVAVRKGNSRLLEKLDQAVMEYTRSDQFGTAYASLYSQPKPFWTPERWVRYAGGVIIAVLGLVVLMLLWWHKRRMAALGARLAECRARLAKTGEVDREP